MRILLTGNLFHNYELDIGEGLRELGHQVDIRFNNIHGPFQIQDPKTIPAWLAFGVLPYKLNIDLFSRASIARYNKDLVQMMDSTKYDMMLVVGAKTIYPETLERFQTRKVLWFMDGLPRYQEVIPKLSLFDDLFVFEPTDIQYIKEKVGLTAQFLTLAFSPRRYYRQSSWVDVDCSFVGACYPKREEFLNALLKITNRMWVYGDFYRSKHRGLRKKLKGVNVHSDIVNSLYNRTRINVNIHHPQSKEGLAIRTFEILGAAGFQMVERQKGALQYFEEDRHMVFYDSLDEFLDKCQFYLVNERERVRIARAGYRLAHEKHTWKARFVEMFDMMRN